MLPEGVLYAELRKAVCASLELDDDIYLVGGVIRDYLLKRPGNDIDFVVKHNSVKIARKIADIFDGKFYIMDEERGIARALITIKDEPLVVDFARMAVDGIKSDLKQRDFTINAIAQNINETWNPIDPLHGMEDLKKSMLRPCSSSSFENDPVRTIRTVRFIQNLGFSIEAKTSALIQQAVPGLAETSAERKRDEVFHIFETKNVKISLKMMREFGVWDEIFPLLIKLESIDHIPPHVHNTLEHTLCVLDYCQIFLDLILSKRVENNNSISQSTLPIWDDFRKELNQFLENPIHAQRKYDGLLFLGVLYHDVGKLSTPAEHIGKRVLFPSHAEISARTFKKNSTRWALSNSENKFIERLIYNHTLSKNINGTDDEVSRRALYRFYQQAGSAGVLISLLHLADILATYEDSLTEKRWQQALNTSHALLESWFRKYDQIVDPPVLVKGGDLMRRLKLKPGKELGYLLDSIREAQAGGVVTDRKTAFVYAEGLLNEKGS